MDDGKFITQGSNKSTVETTEGVASRAAARYLEICFPELPPSERNEVLLHEENRERLALAYSLRQLVSLDKLPRPVVLTTSVDNDNFLEAIKNDNKRANLADRLCPMSVLRLFPLMSVYVSDINFLLGAGERNEGFLLSLVRQSPRNRAITNGLLQDDGVPIGAVKLILSALDLYAAEFSDRYQGVELKLEYSIFSTEAVDSLDLRHAQDVDSCIKEFRLYEEFCVFRAEQAINVLWAVPSAEAEEKNLLDEYRSAIESNITKFPLENALEALRQAVVAISPNRPHHPILCACQAARELLKMQFCDYRERSSVGLGTAGCMTPSDRSGSASFFRPSIDVASGASIFENGDDKSAPGSMQTDASYSPGSSPTSNPGSPSPAYSAMPISRS